MLTVAWCVDACVCLRGWRRLQKHVSGRWKLRSRRRTVRVTVYRVVCSREWREHVVHVCVCGRLVVDCEVVWCRVVGVSGRWGCVSVCDVV